jgi:hypothetical protein
MAPVNNALKYFKSYKGGEQLIYENVFEIFSVSATLGGIRIGARYR